jgi:hypothetical protein
MLMPFHVKKKHKKGVALLVSLWIMLIVSLIVGSFTFEVTLEGLVASKKRNRFRAEILARSGIEFARALVAQSSGASQFEIEALPMDQAELMGLALFIKKGLPIAQQISVTNMGTLSIEVTSAENGRNVNLLTVEQWHELFQMANVPPDEWSGLTDCLADWIDEGDAHRINGAESDDPFYADKAYPVKNRRLDSVNELLLIKNWYSEILYGQPALNEDDSIFGISDLLTVWGDGKIPINSASTNTLLSFAEYEDWELESVMQTRKGLDGEEGTLDDGINSLDQINADSSKFKLQSDFLRVTSRGICSDTVYIIEAIVRVEGTKTYVVYWNEKPEMALSKK